MKTYRRSSGPAGFTLLETLLVVVVIVILAGIALPAYQGIVRAAYRTHTVNGLRQITNGVHLWGADNSGKIPSPVYPGGLLPNAQLPEYHDLGTGGETGMWLNGVVYATVQLGLDGMSKGDAVPLPPDSPRASAGDHLIGTVFESKISVKFFGDESDWYRHSYAMNANLQYDEIAELGGSSDPWLTEKDVTKFNQPKAMLFVDCMEKNVVYAEDASLLVETADLRHDGAYVIAAFLDGNVRKVPKLEIPTGDPNFDRESSLFWRGVDEDDR